MSVKISFIVPVYNLENQLEECLNSLLKQSCVKECEVILVDDGSTDDSGLICQKYCKEHTNFNYYRIVNGGVSCARNYGLSLAKGKYVCFLDGDDFYINDFANYFYEKCLEYDLDFIRGRYCIYHESDNTSIIYDKNINFYEQVMDGSTFLEKTIKANANEVVPWLGLYKRSFLIENKIMFPKGIAYEEDHVFFLKALIYSKRTMITNNVFYSYRFRKDGASKTFSLKKAFDVIDVVKNEFSLLNEFSGVKKKYYLKFISSSFYQLTSIYGRISKDDRLVLRQKLKENKIALSSFKNFSTTHQALKIFVFFAFPHLLSIYYDVKK